MLDFFRELFDADSFIERSATGPWTRVHIGLHVAADLALWIASVAIPVVLALVVFKRRDLPFPRVFRWFAIFILATGTVALLDAFIFWWPAFRLYAAAKLIAAAAAWGTLITLAPVIPKVLRLRSHEELEHEVAGRRRAEQALRESEALYESLIESLPLNVFRKDKDSRILYANGRFCETVSLPLSRLIGRTDRDLFPAAMAEKYLADDALVVSTGQVLEAVEEHRRPDGKLLHVQVLKAPVRDAAGKIVGVQGMFWDVTARHQAEIQARRSDARFRRLVQANLIGVLTMDLAGQIYEANDAFLRIVSFDREELAAGRLRFDSLTPPEHRAADHAAIQQLQEFGSCSSWEKEFLRRDGTRVPVLVGMTLLEGDEDQCICFVVDLSTQKQTQAQLKQAKEQAEAASQAKTRFVANISHEIRTPMNAILGMAELLLEGQPTAEQREYLGLIRQSGESLLTIIHDLLEFSKFEVGRIDLVEREFDLADMLADTLRLLAGRACEKGIELALRIDPETPRLVVGDATRIRQIVTNLVGNAVKFTDEGEVVLHLSAAPAEGGECELHLAVTDTGPGVAADKLELIFAPFEQGDSSTTRRTGGTGLGLPISRRLAERMGGTLSVESFPGAGSTFHCTLRLRVPESARAAAPQVPGELRGTRVLIVENNATQRGILSDLVRDWGCAVDTEPDADAGLATLRQALAAGRPYDVLIADAQMPHRDGFWLVEQRHAERSLARHVVLLLNAIDRSRSVTRCERIGADAYLLKPVKAAELLAALRLALGLEPAAASAEPAERTPRLRRLRILLAEDSLVNQKLILGWMRRNGHAVQVASDGKQALAAAEAGDFDVILMDVQMPHLDGLEATRLIRARESRRGRRTPIIALTAHASATDRSTCLAAGMDSYLTKPVGGCELFETILGLVPGAERVTEPAAEAATADDPSRGDSSGPAGVDWPTALRTVNGDRRLLVEIAEAYLAEAPKLTASMQAAVAARDGAALLRAAHTLKGSLRYFGAARAEETAYRLEQIGRESAWQRDSASELQLLCQDVSQIAAELSAFIATGELP